MAGNAMTAPAWLVAVTTAPHVRFTLRPGGGK
jgi:hypothetical protein